MDKTEKIIWIRIRGTLRPRVWPTERPGDHRHICAPVLVRLRLSSASTPAL